MGNHYTRPPFPLTGPEVLPRQLLPDGFYVLRWQEPGRAEADFGRLDVKTVVKNIYILFSGSSVDTCTPLPSWFTEEDLANYATLYEKSGFRTALQVPYRAWLEDCGITELKVRVPAMLIMGKKDYVLKFPGMAEYISDHVKEYVSDLETTYVRGNSFRAGAVSRPSETSYSEYLERNHSFFNDLLLQVVVDAYLSGRKGKNGLKRDKVCIIKNKRWETK